ncbi:MAG TPA: MBL fold metallo-hydrolase [Gemmatimonadaceae bacterium]|nr:MBL fold metallo-hydrolase [Gemmatimonadaceae bacterium]
MTDLTQQEARVPVHHRPGGGFRNPWPGAQMHGLLDFFKWTLVERQRIPRRPAPDPGTFVRVPPEFVVPRAAPEELTITWIGHTSFLIQMAGLNILLDPIWSERASPIQAVGPRRWVPPAVEFDRLPPIDVVVLSHDHYDHLDATTISRIARRYPAVAWFASLGVGAFLRRRGAREVTERDWWQESAIGALSLTCVPAQHFSGRTLGRRNTTLWCGWVFRSAHQALFFAGDTALHPEFGTITKRCGPFDVAILPIGAYEPRWFMGSVHMNPEDSMKAITQMSLAQAGKRLVMVAAHWGTFKLTDEPMDEPPAKMREEWKTSGLDSNDLWIMRHGETRRLG